jgi:hypothetical protein
MRVMPRANEVTECAAGVAITTLAVLPMGT